MNNQDGFAEKRRVIDLVYDELVKQENKWGSDHDLHHSPQDWVSLITFRLGRYLSAGWLEPAKRGTPSGNASLEIRFLVQVAALAISAAGARLRFISREFQNDVVRDAQVELGHHSWPKAETPNRQQVQADTDSPVHELR